MHGQPHTRFRKRFFRKSLGRSFSTRHHKSGDRTPPRGPCGQHLSGLPSMVVSPFLTAKFVSTNMSSTQSMRAAGNSRLIIGLFYWFRGGTITALSVSKICQLRIIWPLAVPPPCSRGDVRLSQAFSFPCRCTGRQPVGV